MHDDEMKAVERELAELSLRLDEQSPDRLGLLADTMRKRGDLVSAEKLARKAVEVAEWLGQHPLCRCDAYVQLGDLLLAQGKPTEAERYLRGAWRLAEEGRAQSLKRSAILGFLSKAVGAQGKDEEARRLAVEATCLLKNLMPEASSVNGVGSDARTTGGRPHVVRGGPEVGPLQHSDGSLAEGWEALLTKVGQAEPIPFPNEAEAACLSVLAQQRKPLEEQRLFRRLRDHPGFASMTMLRATAKDASHKGLLRIEWQGRRRSPGAVSVRNGTGRAAAVRLPVYSMPGKPEELLARICRFLCQEGDLTYESGQELKRLAEVLRVPRRLIKSLDGWLATLSMPNGSRHRVPEE